MIFRKVSVCGWTKKNKKTLQGSDYPSLITCLKPPKSTLFYKMCKKKNLFNYNIESKILWMKKKM